MTPSRILAHAVILAYLLVTLLALLHTLFRVRTDFLWELTHFSYGMMAPYQGYSLENAEFTAEGELPDGSVEVVDLDRYFPVLLGERNLREFNLVRGKGTFGDAVLSHRSVAAKILSLENARGKPYVRVRLSWTAWPMSLQGFRALKESELATHQFLATYP